MPFLGEIRAFTSELPRGWLPCEGQTLEIDKHVALYSLLGTRFGGDGRRTFELPDLRGRVTAGVDPRRDEKPGDTSGHTAERNAAIPYRVEHWAIAVSIGEYPAR
jgi:microcystin-dependent protein